jgi:hypothetical protein
MTENFATESWNKCRKITEVKFFLCLINYAPRHEDAWGRKDIDPSFLTSALNGGEMSVSRPCHFIPGAKFKFVYNSTRICIVEGCFSHVIELQGMQSSNVFCPTVAFTPKVSNFAYHYDVSVNALSLAQAFHVHCMQCNSSQICTSLSHRVSNIRITLLFSQVDIKISCCKSESHNSLLWHPFYIQFT